MDCLFCKIKAGEIPAKTLYEDEKVMVIMDINPTSNGHTLVIPKKHITDFTEMDDETLAYLNKIAKEIKTYLYEALSPDGLVLTVNYGITQVIKHYHLHLVPAYKEKKSIQPVEEVYKKIKQVIK